MVQSSPYLYNQNSMNDLNNSTMKTKITIIVVFTALFVVNAYAQEQVKRFGFEISGGPSVSLSQPGGSDLNVGGGIEGIFHYRFLAHTGVYAGWGWSHFPSDESFAGQGTDFEETGYVIGLQYQQEIKNTSLSYYFRGGALYNHLELENRDGDLIGDTHHGWGWQVAGGVYVPIGKTVNITTGLKLNSLSRPLEYNGNARDLDLRHLSLRVGIIKNF
jgi:hypothetical protein